MYVNNGIVNNNVNKLIKRRREKYGANKLNFEIIKNCN